MHELDNIHNSLFDEEASEITSAYAVLSCGVVGIYVMSITPLTLLFTWATMAKVFWGFGVSIGGLVLKSIASEIYDYAKPRVIKYAKSKLVKYKLMKNDNKKSNEKAA